MTIVADLFRFVVGVDTHAATHTYTILDAAGRMIDQQQFPTSPAGLARAIDWIGRRTDGDLDATLVTVEGTGTYGAVLAAHLATAGYRVVEAPTPRRDRATGKNDALDSLTAARSTLSMRTDRLRDRRGGGDQHIAGVRGALQVLVTAREQVCGERTRAVNALTALLRVHDLGIDARRALTNRQITTISRWRCRSEEPIDIATARTHAIRLATRITELDSHLADNLAQIKQLALHTIVLTRMRCDPATRAYAERRRAEGKTTREIRRILKRYTSRQLYRTLNASTA